MVLGSGWGDAVGVLGDPLIDCPTTDLPGFPPSTVPGHSGQLRLADAGGVAVLISRGRVHLYEGHGASTVAHGVRTAILAGVSIVILTNACGSINAAYGPGTPILLRDHLNLTGQSPLTGPPPPAPHPIRFVDMSNCYSPRLRQLAREIDPSLAEGVYAQFLGPQYETPAEVQMARILGADLVGMSTAIEAIAARHLGAEVLGLSLVTNLAAGVGTSALDHEEVVAVGAAASDRMAHLLRALLTRALS